MGMILIDLLKDFDVLDNGTFFKNLKYIGFLTETVTWFQSYLKKQNLIEQYTNWGYQDILC